MRHKKEKTDWLERMCMSSSTLTHLTLRDVAVMSTRQELEGWYVAPCNGRWSIGRRSRAEHYPIILNGHCLTFESMGRAAKYLGALLAPTAFNSSWRGRSRPYIEVCPMD